MSRLARYPHFSTDDLDELREFDSRLLDRRVAMVAGPGGFHISAHNAQLDLLAIGAAEIVGELSTHAFSRSYSLLRVEAGEAARRFVGRHGHFLTQGDGSFTSPGRESKTTLRSIGEINAAVMITLPEALVKREAEHLIGDGVIGVLEIKAPLDLRPETYIGQIIDFLLDQLERDDGGVFKKFPRIAQQFQGDLAAALIEHTHNNYTSLVARHFGGAAYRQVALAEEYIAEHLRESLTIGDLANAAHVSVRTLRDACHRQRHVTPEILVRNMRLHAAHRRLEHPQHEDTVASVAHEFQFANVGRFSQQYRREFRGESPAETLQLGRKKVIIALGDALKKPPED